MAMVSYLAVLDDIHLACQATQAQQHVAQSEGYLQALSLYTYTEDSATSLAVSPENQAKPSLTAFAC